MRSRHTVDNRRYRNLTNWFANNKNAIFPLESKFQYERGDLFPITDRPKMPITSFFDRFNGAGFVQNWSCFQPKKSRDKQVESPTTKYFSTVGTDVFLTAVVVFIGLGLLIGPLWWLNEVSNPYTRLEVITGSILVFTILFIGTRSNGAFEILAAAAA
jgi:hypothetical protein